MSVVYHVHLIKLTNSQVSDCSDRHLPGCVLGTPGGPPTAWPSIPIISYIYIIRII
jgi:hypothetical protein